VKEGIREHSNKKRGQTMFVSDITQDYCDCYLSALALKALVAKYKNL